MKPYIRKSEYNFESVKKLEDGQSKRLAHVLCPMGSSPDKKNLSVTRKGNTLFGMCFKCNGVLVANLGIPSVYREAEEKSAFHSPVEFFPLSPDAISYLAKYGINHDDPVFHSSNIELFSGDYFAPKNLIFKIYTDETHELFSTLTRNNGTSGPKWVYRKHPSALKSVRITRKVIPSETVILTEDIISAIRVNNAILCDTVACLGTTIGPDELSWLLTTYSKIIIWFDFDTAGTIGSYNLYNTLKQFIDNVHIILPDDTKDLAKDPKDFSIIDIRNKIKDIYAE